MALRRYATVTILLACLGAAIGALLGFGVSVLLSITDGPPHWGTYLRAYLLRAAVGGAVGAVLAPLAAWTFMRHVPLWRAVVETALGTSIGVVVGLLVGAEYLVLTVLCGFFLAAVRLRLLAPLPTGIDPDRAG